MIILCAAVIGLTACNETKEQKADNSNPFFTEYTTPYGVPPFEQIKPEHYMPAFEEGMKQEKANIEAILANKEEPTFENTIVAMDKAGDLLSKVSSVFFAQTNANTNEALQQVQVEISPKLAAHGDEISLNPELFKRIKSVYENKGKFNLTQEETFILENIYKGLVRGGADLPKEKKEQLMKVNQRMSTLAVQFDQNLLAETNAFQMVIENEADLAGLPESVRAAGAADAKAAGLEGKWLYTVSRSSMYPFLQYSEKRELREKLYKGYINRCNNNNENDNKTILSEIVKLRVERANLLGYENHAQVTLEPRMAGNPETAIELLMKLWNAALPMAKDEARQMQEMIDAEGGNYKLAAWDWWYYAEKIRMSKYNLDESEIRPYFELNNVRDGAFAVAEKLFGITFTEMQDVPLPHPDAQAFEVKEEDGSPIGVLYMDFHPRASKQQGAWCLTYRDHQIAEGKDVLPVVTNVCNFTKPTGDTPALLSIGEAETLFHEFGHGLDALFSQTSYKTNFIAWDFVELPSQIMEHWVMEKDVLKMYAKHYKTGEVIPEELVAKLDAVGKFNMGFVTTEFVAAALLDLAYHTQTEAELLDVAKFEKEYLNSIGLIPEIAARYRSTYFAHIVGGYDAGYYSYIWAGVLDNDAFDAFKEKGIFDRATAESFRKNRCV